MERSFDQVYRFKDKEGNQLTIEPTPDGPLLVLGLHAIRLTFQQWDDLRWHVYIPKPEQEEEPTDEPE